MRLFGEGAGVRLLMLFLLLLFFQLPLHSQTSDTTETLSLNDFLELVIAYHPLAKQADLIPQEARQRLVTARGGFDPFLFSTLDNKEFSGTEYFFLNETGVKVPLWLGMEVRGGYAINRGDFLNPENTLPAQGQMLAGLSANIGQGLFTDARRTALRQAKIFREASRFQRIALLNDLLLASTHDYWHWAMYYNILIVFNEAYDISQQQFENVKNAFLLGDVPAIDTLEAFIQLQDISFSLNQAQLQFANAGLQLSNHLWSENLMPLRIRNNQIPERLSEVNFDKVLTLDSLNRILDAIAEFHPEIRQLQYAIEQLDAERKLKLESLKPRVNFNYNLLSEQRFRFVSQPDIATVLSTNYKWGFDISMPLFWGQGRGQYRLAQLKVKEAGYQLDFKNAEVSNKIQSFFNDLITLRSQIELFDSAADNYRRLLAAERIRFDAGESSVFLINTRQLKLLEFQTKLLEVKARYNMALAGIAWASGMMGVQ